MARMIKVRLILELREAGLSRSAIVRTRAMSKTSVCEVFALADELGVGFVDVRDMTDEGAYRLLYPERNSSESVYVLPDWGHVHAELAKVGVTLKLLHSEYVDKQRGGDGTMMAMRAFAGSTHGTRPPTGSLATSSTVLPSE
jgi:hypothetical protein